MKVYWSAEAVDRPAEAVDRLRELTAFIEKDSPKAAREVAARRTDLEDCDYTQPALPASLRREGVEIPSWCGARTVWR